MVEVTQEVREAAADYYAARDGTSWGQQYIRDGMDDDDIAVQALATIYQRGKLEGARLAIDAAALMAAGSLNTVDAHDRIRALSPAKIVGEG